MQPNILSKEEASAILDKQTSGKMSDKEAHLAFLGVRNTLREVIKEGGSGPLQLVKMSVSAEPTKAVRGSAKKAGAARAIPDVKPTKKPAAKKAPVKVAKPVAKPKAKAALPKPKKVVAPARKPPAKPIAKKAAAKPIAKKPVVKPVAKAKARRK